MRSSFLAVLLFVFVWQPSDAELAAEVNSRTFQLRYAATLSDLGRHENVRVWLPLPPSDDVQEVSLQHSSLDMAQVRRGRDKEFGNSILFFEAPRRSSFEFHLDFLVKRRELRVVSGNEGRERGSLNGAERTRYLRPNRLVPITGKPLHLLPSNPIQASTLETARILYDLVDAHVRYDKSLPGYGNGDVLWVCDSRFGNCTDFHSLFISLARSQQIPARFEIGFPLPASRGAGKIAGYHCWASFFDQQLGWVPVDISEADKQPDSKDYYFGNLTENRIRFTTGRDIVLEPRQSGPPLNYFVYPYVEADGKPIPKSVHFTVQYEDLD